MVSVLKGFPRHLSQHVGGFVLTQGKLTRLVPVEPASMEHRSVIQWDKDDLDTMGLLKVDVLALGMLSALRRCLNLREALRGERWDLQGIPREDPATYDMICAADTVGVFQIESRAQMSMLPRLRPREFYDLVVEVAIVRPGPIQGGMVHPYLQARERRRRGEPLQLEKPELEAALARTLGVPIFQEQVMQIAMVAAGFSAGMADDLRRSMAAWKRKGGVHRFERPLVGGMEARGYRTEFAQAIFQQMLGFGEYGFPESHAHSFALLAYASSWLKCHEPEAFTCSLINSLPMGFYSADQLLQDARRHRIRVLPVDVRYSEWDCTLEFPGGAYTPPRSPPAIRLGLRMVQGFSETVARQVHAARLRRPFGDVDDLCRRAALDERHRSLLADAGALKALAGHRHRARWAIAGVEPQLPLFAEAAPTPERTTALPMPTAGEDLALDYATTGTTLGRHPLAMIRKALTARRCKRSSELDTLPHGRRVRTAGLVTLRQRPQTASGVTFLTLEDETGMVNAVVWRHLADRQHRVLVDTQLMQIDGRLERVDGVQHVIVQRMLCLDELLQGLRSHSRDFH